MKEVFIVDSNFFIQAHRDNYPLDVAFSFWNKVKQLADAGKIMSIDKVKNELYDKNDALETWCKANLPNDFFKASSLAISEYSRVSAWAMSKSSHYLPKALNEFLDADEADAFIISYALTDLGNYKIVTQEKSEPKRQNKIKIPDVCKDFNISCMNTIEMFRKLGETF